MISGQSTLRALSRRTGSRLRTLAETFSRGYWAFFCAALCMDLGMGLYFFLFNLYLADLHFNERVIGQTMACLTLGNVVGAIPAAIFARRQGLRRVLQLTFIGTPLLCILRALIPGVPAQLLLAFATGMALCGWPICFSPTIAKLTNETNRALGFSVAFATGIGLATTAGLAGGYLPQMICAVFPGMPLVGGIRVVLLQSCVITFLGLLPLHSLKLEPQSAIARNSMRLLHPYLLRFLPGFILWSIVMGSFPMFGAVYLQNSLGVPLGRLGEVFSASELLQFAGVLFAPLLFRRLGTNKGIAAAQFGAACFLVLIASSKSGSFAISFYLIYFAAQYMCEPGIYKLLMDSVPEADRSSASAVQNICGAVCQAGAMAITGACIVKFGYAKVLLIDAAVAVIAALFFFLIGIEARSASAGLIETEERLNPDMKAVR